MRLNTVAGNTTVLVLLDLSAAFDTVDHKILLHRLEHWIGFSGTFINWLRSYLRDRSFYVTVGHPHHLLPVVSPAFLRFVYAPTGSYH